MAISEQSIAPRQAIQHVLARFIVNKWDFDIRSKRQWPPAYQSMGEIRRSTGTPAHIALIAAPLPQVTAHQASL